MDRFILPYITLPCRNYARHKICQRTVVINNNSNTKKRRETQRKSFGEKHQIGSNLRESKLESLIYSTSILIIRYISIY